MARKRVEVKDLIVVMLTPKEADMLLAAATNTMSRPTVVEAIFSKREHAAAYSAFEKLQRAVKDGAH